MAESPDAKPSSFSPGKKFPLLGINLQTTNRWVRWGLPIATGLVGVLVLWYLN